MFLRTATPVALVLVFLVGRGLNVVGQIPEGQECKGTLVSTTCVNPCVTQTCEEYLRDGEIEPYRCFPSEGHPSCQPGCRCPGSQKSEPAVPQEFGLHCVDRDSCGCLGPDDYYQVRGQYKTTADDGTHQICTCQSNHEFTCEVDEDWKCPAVNLCWKSCIEKSEKTGCDYCKDPVICS